MPSATAVPDSAAKPAAVADITAVALSAPRPDTTFFAMSPKYVLSDVLGAGWAHALPQRYSQVTAERPGR